MSTNKIVLDLILPFLLYFYGSFMIGQTTHMSRHANQNNLKIKCKWFDVNDLFRFSYDASGFLLCWPCFQLERLCDSFISHRDDDYDMMRFNWSHTLMVTLAVESWHSTTVHAIHFIINPKWIFSYTHKCNRFTHRKFKHHGWYLNFDILRIYSMTI